MKIAVVATTAVVVLIVVVVGLASLAPKSKPQSANELPVARFVYDVDSLNVVFNASLSNDPDGEIANYSWGFGDGDEGFGEVVEHGYVDNGSYTVELTVTDDKGGANSSKKDLTVKMTIIPTKEGPVAVIEIVEVNELTVQVTGAKSSASKDSSIENYTWNFGDGESAYGATATHMYAANGTYTIALTVRDSNGETNSTSVDVTVKTNPIPPPPPPPPPPHEDGPPGLLHAIEIHKEKADRNAGLQNSLDHLEKNLEDWLNKHASP
jgi:PKD repeat protein